MGEVENHVGEAVEVLLIKYCLFYNQDGQKAPKNISLFIWLS